MYNVIVVNIENGMWHHVWCPNNGSVLLLCIGKVVLLCDIAAAVNMPACDILLLWYYLKNSF